MKETKTRVTLNEIFFAYYVNTKVSKQCNLHSNNVKIIHISVINKNQIKIEFKFLHKNTIHFALFRPINTKTLKELATYMSTKEWIYKEVDINNNEIFPTFIPEKIFLELKDLMWITIYTYYMLDTDKYNKLEDVMGGFWCISKLRVYPLVLEWKRRYNNFSKEELENRK
nr:MAG TPA: hypothetical protein [Bacteriophage sp.]